MSNSKILVIGAIFTIGVAAFLFWPKAQGNVSDIPEGKIEVVMYKNPGCDCCTKWASHMNKEEFFVIEEPTDALMTVKRNVGVPARFESCHTAVVGSYFVEGHVPVEDVQRLLRENPDALGLTVPGMPTGSPGMEGPNPQPYDVYLVAKDGTTSVFASH